MANMTEDLVELAAICVSNANIIKSHLAGNGLPQMSFKQDGPPSFPAATPEIQAARAQLRMASKLLFDLASGPEESLSWTPFSNAIDLAAYRYCYHFGITKAVPLDSTISYEELASKTNTHPTQLKQVIRQIMTSRVFCEPRPGFVAHTASSKLLLDDGIGKWNGWVAEDILPIVGHHIEALEKWGHGNPEPNKASFNTCFDTDLQVFPFYETQPARKERFAGVLSTSAKDPHHHVKHVAAGFDWFSLGATTVVDVGGNVGHASVAIAQSAPQIKCIVQDLPKLIQFASDPTTTLVPESLRDRVTFMPHSFYDPQPPALKGKVDVFFIRNVLHDYSNLYCRKILSNLVAAMTPGGHQKLIIQDQIMPPFGTLPLPQERVMRTMDCAMMMASNAQERDMDEWIQLLKDVDPRLVIKSVTSPPGAATSIIEVVLEEEAVSAGKGVADVADRPNTAPDLDQTVNGTNPDTAIDIAGDSIPNTTNVE